MTGKEAIKFIKKRFYNISLLDVKLPDIEGMELIKCLKEVWVDMEVMMITAHATMDTAIHALNEGACAFITKPINMDELFFTINNFLEKQSLMREKKSRGCFGGE